MPLLRLHPTANIFLQFTACHQLWNGKTIFKPAMDLEHLTIGFLPMSTPPLSNLGFQQIVFCIIRGAGNQGKWTQRVQLTSFDHVITSNLMVDRELQQAVEYKYLSLCLSCSLAGIQIG
jgi:hypothetical protein